MLSSFFRIRRIKSNCESYLTFFVLLFFGVDLLLVVKKPYEYVVQDWNEKITQFRSILSLMVDPYYTAISELSIIDQNIFQFI